jgi:hypothetical protein
MKETESKIHPRSQAKSFLNGFPSGFLSVRQQLKGSAVAKSTTVFSLENSYTSVLFKMI